MANPQCKLLISRFLYSCVVLYVQVYGRSSELGFKNRFEFGTHHLNLGATFVRPFLMGAF